MEWRNLEAVLNEYGEKMKETYRSYLESEGVNASGSLSKSVSAQIDMDGNVYTVSLNMNEYWKWIERGRPATVNGGNGELRRAILNWIKVKPVLPRPLENGKLPTEKQLAYLISRKIHNEGYGGKRLLWKSKEDNEDYYLERIKEAMLKDVALFAEKIIFKVTIS